MRKSIVVVLALLFFATTADAQYFGRNKVQWEHFDFKVLKTEHFDIYYYDREADVVNDIGRMAERWYVRLSRVFNHTFTRKPIVLYANPADFQQTTTTPEIIGQGTGGFTDPFMNRVVMPLTGDYAENDHVLGHELVHVFQFDVANTFANNSRRRFNLEQLPLWIVEGMAEYLSKGRIDPLTAMWIRDATIHNRMPDLKRLQRDPYYFPYRYGEALMAYIGGRFGDDAVVRLFLGAGLAGPEAAFDRATGIPAKQIFIDWAESARELYNPIIQERATTLVTPLIGSKQGVRGYLNIGPAYSPDGRYLAFLSTREIFDIDLFLADAQTGKVIRRLASSGRDAHYESLRFIDSAGTWSPDSKQLAFVVFEKGDNYVGVVDIESRRTTAIRIPGVDAIHSVAWGPSGRHLAIAGQKTGVSDLFLYDMETKQVRQLTNDKFADLQPDFSPDGKTIVFASDRGTGGSLDQLRFSGMRLATVDIDTGRVNTLPLFEGAKNMDPHFGPDGSVYFISNPEGIADVYRYFFADNRVTRVTRVQTGVSGITEMSPALAVAQRTGDIAFSLYEDDNYNIYRLSPPPNGVTVSTAMPPDAARAGQLPPLRGTGSIITTYLQRPEQGLPPENAGFTNAPYNPALHLAYIGPPAVGISTGTLGTGVGGSVSAYFSDILGEHNVGFTFEGGGSTGIGTVGDQIAGEVLYLNQQHRVNWGVDYTHLPYVSAFTGESQQRVVINGQSVIADVIEQQRQIDRYDDISGLLQYPFSTTKRVEFSAGFQRESIKSEVQQLVIVGNQIIDDTTVQLGNNFAINLAHAGGGFVGDSSIFGFLSPIRGTRYRFEMQALRGRATESNVGSQSLNFQTVLGDYRKYFFLRPVTLAVRGIHYGRYGRDAEGFLYPLFVGDQSLVHGYDYNSIGLEECSGADTPNSCPVYDRLFGSKMAIANAEIRVPLFGTREFGLATGFIPTELFGFMDAGVTWNKGESPKIEFARNTNERVPVVSVGAGVRMLLSYIPLEFYYAHPYQRPQKNWVFGFNIIPGW
jgi:Tol biopolymer transport system component